MRPLAQRFCDEGLKRRLFVLLLSHTHFEGGNMLAACTSSVANHFSAWRESEHLIMQRFPKHQKVKARK